MTPRDIKLAYRGADICYTELHDGRFPRTSRQAFGMSLHFNAQGVSPANASQHPRSPIATQPMRGYAVPVRYADGTTHTITTIARHGFEAVKLIAARITGTVGAARPL